MRLRYMHLPSLKPLENITITFGYEPILGRACALHFVVGVNGSGKSRLMRALAEIFLCIERGIAIPFPVTLVYDLGPHTGEEYAEEGDDGNSALAHARHTIYLHRPERGQTVLADFDYIPPASDEESIWETLLESDWEHFEREGYTLRQWYRGDNLPTVYLPSVLLAYTSGATAEWEALFVPQRSASQDILLTTFNALDSEQERPVGWNAFKEQEHQRAMNGSSDDGNREQIILEDNQPPSSCIFVPPSALKIALCAVALDQAAEDFALMSTDDDEQRFRTRINLLRAEGRRMEGLRGILSEVDWLWPVSVGLHIALRPERLTPVQTRQLIRLYRAATAVIREPEPGVGRRLFFDLRAMQRDANDHEVTTVRALIDALKPEGDDTIMRFGLFRELLFLHQQGILEEITLALRKRTLDDVLLFDWLSDGERVFLGRTAFFHLLEKTDDALILLDEPETHFNDYWKREMVDIIDSSLRDNTIEVLFSTHSSIALTDAFETEIILLSKDPDDGLISVEEVPIKSFGTSPIEIMRDIFKAPQTVGQRAAEFLDLMLMLALYPNEVQRVWEEDRAGMTARQVQQLPAFLELQGLISQRLPRALRRDENPAETINGLLLRMLRSVRHYTRQVTGRSEITLIDALDVLQERLGSGYYNFEFRRRVQILREDSNAASS